jgi:hypothetical protein
MENRLGKIIKERERRKFLSELQAAAEKEGHIPSMPALFLRRMEKPLQYAGGLFWGLFLGIITIIISFLLSVIIFHIRV